MTRNPSIAEGYWFARRFPLGDPRKSVAPVSAMGWIMIAAFVFDMIAGAALFLWLATIDQPFMGVLSFLVLTASGWGALMFLVRRKSDHQHTVEDYKAGRVG